MTALVNEDGKTVGFLYNKMLLDTNLKTVLGLILGNCVYGSDAQLVGKFFNNAIRNTEGEIIVETAPSDNKSGLVAEGEVVSAAWDIIMKIKIHVCNWIPENYNWAKKNVVNFFRTAKLQEGLAMG